MTPPTRALRIYLVEDSAIIRDHLVAMLEEVTGAVIVGVSADERHARAWMRTVQPASVDLMIIDLFLSQGSGLELLASADRHGFSPRRVVLTNYATPAVRERCLTLGAEAVFDKSTELDALLDYCNGLAGSPPAAV